MEVGGNFVLSTQFFSESETILKNKSLLIKKRKKKLKRSVCYDQRIEFQT